MKSNLSELKFHFSVMQALDNKNHRSPFEFRYVRMQRRHCTLKSSPIVSSALLSHSFLFSSLVRSTNNGHLYFPFEKVLIQPLNFRNPLNPTQGYLHQGDRCINCERSNYLNIFYNCCCRSPKWPLIFFINIYLIFTSDTLLSFETQNTPRLRK